MRARGKVTVVDDGDSLIIHGAANDGITLENTIADQDIIFKVNHNVTSTEVLRLTGADASLRMKGLSPVEFRTSANSISATDADELTVKSSTIKLDASGDGSGTMDLTTEGSEKMIKIIGETKIASADNIGTYINATESGAYLNVVATGKVDIAATDSVELTALNVVITSGNEFTVDSDFKARGRVTVVDGSDSLTIHGDHDDGVTIKNEIADRGIIFEIENGEVLRLEKVAGTDEALRLDGTNWVRFGDDDISMRKNPSDHLSLRNFLWGGDIVF
jgi:hypothetical protein